VPETYLPGADVRVQALGRLIHTDAQKVIPMLRDIALEGDDPGAARGAVFILAQSRNPDAQMTVVDLAKIGPEPVRVAAVRELGRFGDANVSRELLEVYRTGNVPVRQQVVYSLGERADTGALLKIAQSERDRHLRESAIIALGRAGGREHLRVLYSSAPVEARQAIIVGLFNARDEDALIRIADQEKDPELRRQVLARLRLMGTPKAKEYLQRIK
jgi:HEAT repeat protein